jgi:hypothetical protein
MAKQRKAFGIKIPWIPHGKGAEVIGMAEQDIVKTYEKQLQDLHKSLKDFYAEAAPRGGILTYKDIAADGKLKSLLYELRIKVDGAFYNRAIILKNDLSRGWDKAYTDILYQAERLAYSPQITNNKGVLPWNTRQKTLEEIRHQEEFEEFMREESEKVAQTLGADIAAEREYAKARLQKTLKGALSGAGVTLQDWYKLLKEETEKSAGRYLRIVRTQGNHIINEARVTAFRSEFAERLIETLGGREGKAEDEQGNRLVLVWMHDEPKVPRPWHKDILHKTVPDKNGLWWSSESGRSASSPGGFGSPEEDANCHCYLQLMPISEARGMSTERGVVPIPADYFSREAV